MNKNKTPGSDGIPPEFYLTFWELVSPLLMDSLNHSVEEGVLSIEQRRGVITLIPKKEVDRRRIANWRPITLLNSDYKILTKAIALLLQRHIPSLIHSDQTGFMPHRCIGDNIRTIEDSIHTILSKEADGMVLALDFSKAFDSVRWDMIFFALKFFSFGEGFIGIIKSIFTGIESAVLNVGTTSRFFRPKRGFRQGCCALPYLFNLVVEVLAILIRQDVHIKGLHLHQSEIKVSQFVDDLTCFVSDASSMTPLMDHLDKFSGWSGLKINVAKSQLLYPKGINQGLESLANIPVRDSAHISGIWFFLSHDEHRNYENNFRPLLDKARQICRTWNNRSLSLKGKVTVVNSLVTSVFQYRCTYIHTPPEVFREFRTITTAFLWNNLKAKVAYKTLTLPTSEGGLNLIDLEIRTQAALLQCIRRMLAQPKLGASAFL